MSIEEIKLPNIGEDEVEVIEIAVNIGDKVEEEEAIIVVETEKASMDIPSSFSGNIETINVKVGDKLSEGDLICTLKKVDQNTKETQKKEEKEEPIKEEVNSKEENKELSLSVQNTSTTIEDVLVPDIGEDGEVDVIEIGVNIGDEVEEEDGLITLETEKATMDVPAPFKGVVKELLVKAGDKVSTGTLIAKIEKVVVTNISKEEANPKLQSKDLEPKTQIKKEIEKIEEKNSFSEELVKTSTKVYASPSIRKIAREFGVNLALVKGTGRKNRILREDIKEFIKKQLQNTKTSQGVSKGSFGFDLPTLKPFDFSKFGETQTVELSRIQKISGPNLHRNWVSIPHVVQFDEVDITKLEAFRKEQNASNIKKGKSLKISPLVFALKAVSKALELHPKFNSSLSVDGQSIIYKKYINIAVAVDTPNGLVVPVIKEVNKKGIETISTELVEISKKAREGKLKAQDMQGACFTISSLGGIGGTSFTPIINAPEVAILGVSKSQIKPYWNGEAFEPRLMLPLSLSYDHRVVDGADGARFITTLSNLLSDIRLLLL